MNYIGKNVSVRIFIKKMFCSSNKKMIDKTGDVIEQNQRLLSKAGKYQNISDTWCYELCGVCNLESNTLLG